MNLKSIILIWPIILKKCHRNQKFSNIHHGCWNPKFSIINPFIPNHILESRCSNFDAYPCLFLIAQITILFSPFSGLLNRNKFDSIDLDISNINYLCGHNTWNSTWLSRSWESIEANNGVEKLNKSLPCSALKDLCLKH